MNLRTRIAAGGLAVAGTLSLLAAPAGVAAASEPATAASETVTNAACTDGHWPASVQGRPIQFHANATGGDYIWHDSKGWHLRVTHHGTGHVVFTGKIVSSAPLDEVPVKLEKNDVVTLSADKRTITYRYNNYGAIDGFDFVTSCAKHLTFYGRMGSFRLTDGRIWIGHYGRHPLENPFTISRIG